MLLKLMLVILADDQIVASELWALESELSAYPSFRRE